MDNINKKKKQQLGIPAGTANAKLRKTLLFSLVVKLNENSCFQCGFPITEEKDFSIEHKIPWLDAENPKELFFDLDNISFSHLKCNLSAARKVQKKYFTKEEKIQARREIDRKSHKNLYSTEKRRVKYAKHGY